jgi:prepilin-type N-terminal cleavage/methylation domain-containing protein
MTCRRGRLHADDGVTIVELMVSMLIASIVAVVFVTWMSSAVTTANLHRDDDRAVQDLRQAKDRLTRELRMADELLLADRLAVTMWVDENADGVVDSGEIITWTFTGGGELVRSTDAGDSFVVMREVVVAESGFTFDSATLADIRTVSMVLVAFVGEIGGTREIATQIYLRNA